MPKWSEWRERYESSASAVKGAGVGISLESMEREGKELKHNLSIVKREIDACLRSVGKCGRFRCRETLREETRVFVRKCRRGIDEFDRQIREVKGEFTCTSIPRASSCNSSPSVNLRTPKRRATSVGILSMMQSAGVLLTRSNCDFDTLVAIADQAVICRDILVGVHQIMDGSGEIEESIFATVIDILEDDGSFDFCALLPSSMPTTLSIADFARLQTTLEEVAAELFDDVKEANENNARELDDELAIASCGVDDSIDSFGENRKDGATSFLDSDEKMDGEEGPLSFPKSPFVSQISCSDKSDILDVSVSIYVDTDFATIYKFDIFRSVKTIRSESDVLEVQSLSFEKLRVDQGWVVNLRDVPIRAILPPSSASSLKKTKVSVLVSIENRNIRSRDRILSELRKYVYCKCVPVPEMKTLTV